MKVWDIYNNSSEAYTEFIVAESSRLALNHVLNYPNPFTTRTSFFFEHNRPCNTLNVQVQIYTVSGKLIKTIDRDITCEGYRVDDLDWDGRDDFGDRIGRGVYVYRLKVRSQDGASAEKYEKLVVLK
jgi:flagellar hook assembly protein FlgD